MSNKVTPIFSEDIEKTAQSVIQFESLTEIQDSILYIEEILKTPYLKNKEMWQENLEVYKRALTLISN